MVTGTARVRFDALGNQRKPSTMLTKPLVLGGDVGYRNRRQGRQSVRLSIGGHHGEAGSRWRAGGDGLPQRQQ